MQKILFFEEEDKKRWLLLEKSFCAVCLLKHM